ncbi:PP2C family protein-serine/threonine phosphatase [Chlamydia sp. 17-3921]|uniref:PP2C family protein-serine/threonine phosphatase n=1 Tax=Chlamydia sp. 17-3921 TaxID=2675798 RepID=UPI00191A273A|nr:PP2C family protein-serine/threonine phosphatase [Chlamydia sp. 17-3921]
MIPFTKTIGFRLWLACVTAIIVPLGINIVLLNIEQYHSTVSSISNSLKENAAFKANTLMQIVPLNANVLALFSEVLQLDQGIPENPDTALSNEMQRVFSTTYDEISLIKIQANGDKIVVASNLLEHLGENYTNKITISPNEEFSASFKRSSTKNEVFSVMQSNLFNPRTQDLEGIVYTTFNAHDLLKNLLINQQAYLTVKTAVISKNGVILKASDPALNLRTTHSNISKQEFCKIFLNEDTCPEDLYLEPLSLIPLRSLGSNFFSFKIKNREAWGYIENLSNMDIAILSYSKKDDSFSLLWRRIGMYLAYFICILFGSIAAYLVAKRLSLPIRKLATTMIETRKNLHHPSYTDDSLGFEINRLGHIFNAMISNLNKQQELAKQGFLLKESAQNALQLGEQAQQRLLPNALPNYPHTEIAKAYIPAVTVGGDFYDVFIVGEGAEAKLFLIVADASGKGVSACGYSLFLKNMLRTFLSNSSSLKEAIQKTSSLFYENTMDSGMFVTLCVYCYSYATQTIEYYSCGHNPACYVTPQGESCLLFHQGMALGFLPNIPKTPDVVFHPQPGSLIFLYSDGITEAHNAQQEMFGEERLLSVTRTLKNKSAEEAVHALMLAVKAFVGNSPQHDDITLLVLKISES